MALFGREPLPTKNIPSVPSLKKIESTYMRGPDHLTIPIVLSNISNRKIKPGSGVNSWVCDPIILYELSCHRKNQRRLALRTF
jgi:hypothetical protein